MIVRFKHLTAGASWKSRQNPCPHRRNAEQCREAPPKEQVPEQTLSIQSQTESWNEWLTWSQAPSGTAWQLEQAAWGSRNLGGSAQSHSEMGDAQLIAGTQQMPLLLLHSSAVSVWYCSLPSQSSSRYGGTQDSRYCLDIFPLQRNGELSAKPSTGGNGYYNLVAVIDTCLLNSNSALRKLT